MYNFTKTSAESPTGVPVQRMVRAPEWLLKKLGITQKQWRAKKRLELDTAIKALNVFMIGAAYTPYVDGAFIGKVLSDCEKLREALKVKNWEGRRPNVSSSPATVGGKE